MKAHAHLPGATTTIVVLSLVNLCLLVATAFHKTGKLMENADSAFRLKLGYVAVALGLCSQILYCLALLVWRYEWVPLDLGVNSVTHLEAKLSNIGGLLSAAAVFTALFGTGLRRCAGVWVGITTFWFWSFVGLDAALGSLFR